MTIFEFDKPPSEHDIRKLLLANDYLEYEDPDFRGRFGCDLPYSSITLNNADTNNTVNYVYITKNFIEVYYGTICESDLPLYYITVNYTDLKRIEIVNC